MPRDLSSASDWDDIDDNDNDSEDSIRTFPYLSREERVASPPNAPSPSLHFSLSPETIDADMRFIRASETPDMSKRDELKCFVQSLNPSHVESCTVLEENCFPENERCSREKVGA
jgi:hypothetical protein